MTTFDLTVDGAAASTTSPARVRAHERAARRARRRWFRAGSLWLQAAVFAVALGAGLFTGYLINR